MVDKTSQRISQLTGIEHFGTHPDSAVVFADRKRIDDFCAIYENERLNHDEKVMLMWLIIASFDRALAEEQASERVVSRVTHLIRTDLWFHYKTVEYWSGLRETIEYSSGQKIRKPERCWPVSPIMRKILVDNENSA
jgi:hypothetical protein